MAQCCTEAQAIADLAQEVYRTAGPDLCCHNACQVGAMVTLAICAARAVPAKLVYVRHHPEAHGGPHFLVEVGDDAVVDLLGGKFRVRAAGRQASAA